MGHKLERQSCSSLSGKTNNVFNKKSLANCFLSDVPIAKHIDCICSKFNQIALPKYYLLGNWSGLVATFCIRKANWILFPSSICSLCFDSYDIMDQFLYSKRFDSSQSCFRNYICSHHHNYSKHVKHCNAKGNGSLHLFTDKINGAILIPSLCVNLAATLILLPGPHSTLQLHFANFISSLDQLKYRHFSNLVRLLISANGLFFEKSSNFLPLIISASNIIGIIISPLI